MTTNKTICFLQITRIGDLLETYQAAKSLKESHPEVKLILVCRKQFSSSLNFLLKTVFDSIYDFSFKDLVAEKTPRSLEEFKQLLGGFIAKINTHPIDVLINFSYSKSSNYFSTLIKAKHTLGPSFSPTHETILQDKWSKHVYTSVMGGTLSPFNLVDLYRSVIGVDNSFTPIKSDRLKTKTIVLHPFASHIKKHWKEYRWSEVVFRVLKENPDHSVVIVGSKEEFERGQKILATPHLDQFKNRVQNLAGKISLEDVANLISSAQLFIGHDSSLGHLASIYGTQAVTISLGTVRPHETSPYGAGNVTITPTLSCFPCQVSATCQSPICHNEVNPQLITSVVTMALKKISFTIESIKQIPLFLRENVKIFKSVITSAQLMQLEELSERPASLDDSFRLFYRIVWLYYFTQKEEAHSIPKINDNTYSGLYESLKTLQSLFELAEFGKKYSKFILEDLAVPTPNMALIRKNSDKIIEIDRLQDCLKSAAPMLAPLIDYFKVTKANLAGNNLIELSESSFWAYSDLATCSSMLYDLIEKSLTEYKLKKGIQQKQPMSL